MIPLMKTPNWALRGIYYLCVSLLVLGWLAVPVRAEWSIYAGSGAYWHHGDAVNGAVDQFLGRPPGSGGGGAGHGGSLGDSVSANGPVQVQRHHALALRWHHATAVTPRLDLVGSVRLEYGRTRYFIADGVGVLRDDLTVDLHHLALSPAMALRAALPDLGNWRTDLSLGLGTDMIRARSHLGSALLDVNRTEGFRENFVFLRIDLGHRRRPADRVVLDMQWRDSVDFSLRLGAEHRF
jgi:hypothetical protein